MPISAEDQPASCYIICVAPTNLETQLLELRPNCECCDKDLPPDSTEARICSFECTFCSTCADSLLGGKCPNCGGELLARPRRPLNKLASNPPATTRIHKPSGCSSAA
jgi:hypothetical protein